MPTSVATGTDIRPQPSAEADMEMARRQNIAENEPSPLERIAIALERLADQIAPEPENIVGTEYVAAKMGCSQTHVARLARDGSIPAGCVVPGCGDGRPWKFLRLRIDHWLGVR